MLVPKEFFSWGKLFIFGGWVQTGKYSLVHGYTMKQTTNQTIRLVYEPNWFAVHSPTNPIEED